MSTKEEFFSQIEYYLSVEETMETKNYYVDGDINSMTGDTINHGIISDNIYFEFRKHFQKSSSLFTPYGSNLRIHMDKLNTIVYPDAMIVKGDLEISSKDLGAIVNPFLVVEVLSNTTEEYDRGEKFSRYSQLLSLQEYVLIDSNKVVIELFTRKEDNLWERTCFSGLDTVFQVNSLDLNIDMRKIYDKVETKK